MIKTSRRERKRDKVSEYFIIGRMSLSGSIKGVRVDLDDCKWQLRHLTKTGTAYQPCLQPFRHSAKDGMK